MSKESQLKELKTKPGVGKSIANESYNIGIRCIANSERQRPGSDI